MPKLFNMYCDESCHLPNDGKPTMGLAVVWCPEDEAAQLVRQIRDLRIRHGVHEFAELKWSKVSPSKVALYEDVIELFFRTNALCFRALIADKAGLDHERFGQTHDDWYFKMYWKLLEVVIAPPDRYRVYLDVKDTRSAPRMKKLKEVLCNTIYDFDSQIIERVQAVRSHEVALLQLADVLLGAVLYATRKETGSPAKLALVRRLQRRSKYSLTRSTILGERKFNIFYWKGTSS